MWENITNQHNCITFKPEINLLEINILNFCCFFFFVLYSNFHVICLFTLHFFFGSQLFLPYSHGNSWIYQIKAKGLPEKILTKMTDVKRFCSFSLWAHEYLFFFLPIFCLIFGFMCLPIELFPIFNFLVVKQSEKLVPK